MPSCIQCGLKFSSAWAFLSRNAVMPGWKELCKQCSDSAVKNVELKVRIQDQMVLVLFLGATTGAVKSMELDHPYAREYSAYYSNILKIRDLAALCLSRLETFDSNRKFFKDICDLTTELESTIFYVPVSNYIIQMEILSNYYNIAMGIIYRHVQYSVPYFDRNHPVIQSFLPELFEAVELQINYINDLRLTG